ncbi:MAG: YbaN family protein [Burkholderiaceae bacterium]
MTTEPDSAPRPPWQRGLWIAAGGLALASGVVGIFLPVLPTVPFVLLAAWCFSKGSPRCERWILEHRHFGPMVRDWRTHRSVPLRLKQLALLSMAGGAALAWWLLPASVHWLPAVVCAIVGLWLWRLPTRR